MSIKSGVSSGNIIVPYSITSQNGKVQIQKLNIAEIAINAQTSKENAKACLQRIFRELLTKVRNRENVKMDIPYLGTLMIQNSIAGVKFFETLTEDLKVN